MGKRFPVTLQKIFIKQNIIIKLFTGRNVKTTIDTDLSKVFALRFKENMLHLTGPPHHPLLTQLSHQGPWRWAAGGSMQGQGTVGRKRKGQSLLSWGS